MADSNIIIEFDAEWKDGDLVTPCKYCNDLIVTGGKILCIKVVTSKSETVHETDFIVCNPCYDLIR